MEELSIEDFYLYLAHWESAYPNGIPADLIVEPELDSPVNSEPSSVEPVSALVASDQVEFDQVESGQVQTKHTVSKRAIFLVQLGDYSEESEALFQAAVTKGLQWSMDEVLLVEVEPGQKLSTLVKETVTENIVVLGSFSVDCSEVVAKIRSEPSLYNTASLSAALIDPVAKRQLWNALKSLKNSVNKRVSHTE